MAFPKIRKTYASWARRYQKIHRLVDSPFSYSQRKPVAIQIAGRLACTFLDYKIRAFARMQADSRKARMAWREHSRHTAVGADNTQKQYERMIFQLCSLGICAALIHCSNDKVEQTPSHGNSSQHSFPLETQRMRERLIIDRYILKYIVVCYLDLHHHEPISCPRGTNLVRQTEAHLSFFRGPHLSKCGESAAPWFIGRGRDNAPLNGQKMCFHVRGWRMAGGTYGGAASRSQRHSFRKAPHGIDDE